MEPSGRRHVAIHTEIAQKINFACHQNSFPVVRDLRIENGDAEEKLDDLTVTLSSNPAFLKTKVWAIDRIAADGSVSIQDREIELDGEFLLSISDAVHGTITIQVEKGGDILAEYAQPIELLAYNEWGGAGYMPELLPAFVLPNDPAVGRVLGDAGQVLRKAGKPDQLDGYQSGSRMRVWEVASAIYTAIANLGLTYVVPPASFEKDGQKIRLPAQLIGNGLGTCLDTALLFAAAFEGAGLNPIVAMPRGHAVVGVWLQPEDLSTIVSDEAETLRKRADLKELVLIETTCVTQKVPPSFSKAVQAANETLVPDKDATFAAAVDIKRARAHRINPLGLKTGPVEGGSQDERHAVEIALEAAPPLPDFDTEEEDDAKDETPQSRLDRWQRRLLDLSARNALLNHSATKTSLKMICPNPGDLEDKLAAGARISIQAVPQLSSSPQDEGLHQWKTGEKITDEYAREALEKKQILVDLAADELSKRAVQIYRKTQTALQEGGANTLYLALGFLLWKRDEKDDRRFRAPLILMPVSLERQSVRSGIKIVANDDEPRFNTTLLEMLRRDHSIDIKGLEGTLPADSSGIDVVGVWNTVRKAIKESPGFEVVEDVVLGHFSFAKYLMWKDLVDRTDQLRNNPVVSHLLDSPRDAYPSEVAFVDRASVDRLYKPTDLLCPLPADASQLAAIATADRGKDFVIIGPPGTGKSQTISNLISHLLGKGKTVLFVSEKTAALDVVYRRLERIGLGRFCLQLHSNKARKADVLEQLGRAWGAAAEKSPDEWQKSGDQLLVLRDQLNQVAACLHKKHKNGLTPHYAIGIRVRDDELATRVALSWPSPDQHDQEQLAELRRAADDLATQAQAIGKISESPFHELVSAGDWSPQWEQSLVEKAQELGRAVRDTRAALNTLCEAIGIELPDLSTNRLKSVSSLTDALVGSYRQQTGLALEADGADFLDALEAASDALRSYQDARSKLSVEYEQDGWRALDGRVIRQRWNESLGYWWLKRLLAQRKLRKEMRAGGATGKPDPENDSECLVTMRTTGQKIDDLERSLSRLRTWKQHRTSPDELVRVHELGNRVRVATGGLADDASNLARLRNAIHDVLHSGNDLLAADAIVGRAATYFGRAFADFLDAKSSFDTTVGGAAFDALSSWATSLDAIEQAAQKADEHHADLRDWCAWRKRRNAAIDLQLKPLVDALENGTIAPEETTDAFEAAYCTWWSGAVIGAEPVLRTFSTPEHMATIERFRETDEKFQKLTAEYIAARLNGELPEREDVKRSSDWGILNRELQKKRQHKPVRQLVQEVPEALTRLAPCLMMSPLSVAQYLPADQALFDVVIFDEASQITVWDAVGAVARGRQVVIAGDPKQMPPTSFFSRADDDPDGDVDTEGDLESILDEMRGASIPERLLNLHYRSKRESLIAFSNSRYYDNSLITFPAPVVNDHGVHLRRVDGCYSRGKARHNEIEARAIVAEVVRRLSDPDPEIRNKSLGVVTFNSEQQALIENLLDEARAKEPELEWAFSPDDLEEPVFVKNLETVQGDERDVILFSVTFGPDESGHITMNFGPLNKTGGERRLNVALTRARSEMMVFSSLPPERIDLSRTQSLAVAHLKHFLEFAERGYTVLGSANYGSIGDFESPFETAVARSLREKGWEVHPQIGVSAYRIDLGVVHPDEPGTYLAGIECDGAMYHSSAVARERDKIREAVLRDLGWKLHRIWSTDWWVNKPKALTEVDTWLSQTLKDARAAIVEPEEVEDNLQLVRVASAVPMPSAGQQPDEAAPSNMRSEKPSDARNKCAAPSSSAATAKIDTYCKVDLQSDGFKAAPDRFYEPGYEGRIQEMVDHVVQIEGPIHEDVLVRRIARHHDFQRAGRQIRELVFRIADRHYRKSREEVGNFYWPVDEREAVLAAPRRHLERDSEMRNVEHICMEELRAISEALETNGDPTALARALGILRLSGPSRARLEVAVSKNGPLDFSAS